MVYDIVVPRNSGQLDIIKFIHAKVGETFNFSKVSQLLPFPRLWTGPFPRTLGSGFTFSKVMGHAFSKAFAASFSKEMLCWTTYWTTSPSSPAQLQQRSPMCLAFGC